MAITPAVTPSNYYTSLVKQGAFDADAENQLNALIASNDILVASSQNSNLLGTALGSAITLLPATAPAGTYLFNCYGVVTTILAGNSVSGFSFVLGFTDDNKAQTPTAATVSAVAAGTGLSGSYLFRSNGTAAITFTPTALTGTPTSGALAYSVTLQRVY
jgi:hypothetical protein